MTYNVSTKSTDMHGSYHEHRRVAVLAVALLFATLFGCGGPEPIRRQSSGAVGASRARNVIFDTFATMLNDLPREVNLQLRPPIKILDATTSRDHRDVVAVLREHPKKPTGHNNFLFITSGNSRFEALVKPGDVVRYFIQQEQVGGQSYGKLSAISLTVYQVLNDDALLTAEALPQPILVPSRIEIWRYSDKKMFEIDRRLLRYVRQGEPPIDWEPSPDEAALKTLTDWLNQWNRRTAKDKEWQPDPLLAALPEDLRNLAPEETLRQTTFVKSDGRFLQQAVWLRDVANWAGAEARDDLDLATMLFDWTVRNIHLETRAPSDDPRRSRAGLAYRPWQAMLHGRGTVEERVWVFAQLCRQQGLDVVMLSFEAIDIPEELWAWLPALWHQGKFYLFDPRLGLPIPGPDHQGVATLAEAQESEAVLRQLDVSETDRYPLTAADLQQVVALIPASSQELSWRMKQVEADLTGDQKVTLTVDPTSVADALVTSGLVREVRLWEHPLRTISRQRALSQQQAKDEQVRERAVGEFGIYTQRPKLWKGRVLHFQGTLDGPDGAKFFYRELRGLSDVQIQEANKGPREKIVISFAKMHASYWLGIATYDSGMHEASIDYLKKRTLETNPQGPWTESAQYNLARALEALDRHDEAIALYESDTSVQNYGNRLRAKWLKEKTFPPLSQSRQAEKDFSTPAADE